MMGGNICLLAIVAVCLATVALLANLPRKMRNCEKVFVTCDERVLLDKEGPGQEEHKSS